jgi:hypothetical protein
MKNLDLDDTDSLDNLPRNLRVFFGPKSTAVTWQQNSI